MDEVELPDAAWKAKFRRKLKKWFADHGRDLPWRRTHDAYRIWISEVMLQQTQVATVIPYFKRFLDRFPAVTDLAAADEKEVLRLWEGLGYYRRARQLHKAAKQVADDHGGVFPSDLESVDALPGVGRYTRGAILSFAFDQRQPILEANTIRLNCRLLALEEVPTAKRAQTALWQFAEDILPRKDVGQFNQALMELGGIVCSPKPKCLVCPVASLCPTRAQGLQDKIPVSTKKMKYEDVSETAVVVFKRKQVLLRECQPGERWAGLWDFPRFTTSNSAIHQKQLKELTGIDCSVGKSFATMKHGVTRFRITLDCVRATFKSGRLKRDSKLVWVKPSELDDYPLSTTGRNIAKMLE